MGTKFSSDLVLSFPVLGIKISNAPDQTWFSVARKLLSSWSRAWQYYMKFHSTIMSHSPCHHLSWLNWSRGLASFWTKADLSVIQLFLRTSTNRLLTKPSLFNSAVRALQTWKCFYMLHIDVSLYIFFFFYREKVSTKIAELNQSPFFLLTILLDPVQFCVIE